MDKHTPGPWEIKRWSDKQGSNGISIKGSDGLFIANLVMQIKDNELANARLIAAAPEMREALKAIVSLADDDPFATIGMYVEHGKGSNIRALLARIEGGE